MMSAIVPWTDPGGTPCCCAEDCFIDLPHPEEPYVENDYVSIDEATYVAIYAGGAWTANLSGTLEQFFVATFPSFTRKTVTTFNQSVALQAVGNQDPQYGSCLRRFLSTEFDTDRTVVCVTGGCGTLPLDDTVAKRFSFWRTIEGTAGNRRFAFTTKSESGDISLGAATFADLPQPTRLDVWIVGGFQSLVSYTAGFGAVWRGIQNVSCTVTANLNGQVVSAPNTFVARFGGFASPVFNYTEGSLTADITFTPSAP